MHIIKAKMKTKQYRTLIIITITFLAAGPAMTQHPDDSLLKYIEISAKNNPAVNQKLYEYKAALKRIPQAGSLPDPELTAGIFLRPMELVNGNQAADLRLMQMFPWFGVLRSAKDEMSLMAKARYESFMDAGLQVSYDVQRIWYELYRIRKNISVSEQNLELLRSLENLAVVKFQSASGSMPGSPTSNPTEMMQSSANPPMAGVSGMSSMVQNQPPQSPVTSMQSASAMQQASMGSDPGISGLTDIYQIRIESAELAAKIEGLRDLDRATAAKFNSYLNRSPESSVFTPGSLDPDTLFLPVLPVSDTILKSSPMLGMLDYEIQSVEARRKMIRGMGYPMVGLGINYSIIGSSSMSVSGMNGKDMVMPMLSVTLPVYRKKYKAMAAEADLLKSAAINDYASAANTLQAEVYMALQQYNDAKRRIRLYKYQAGLASKSLGITIKSYSASAASLSELLRIRQQTYDYELKVSEALADLNTSVALLKRLTASSGSIN